MLFYAITDRHLADPIAGLERLVARHGEGLWIQLREKDLPSRALFALGREILILLSDRGPKLLINDRVDVARALGRGVGVQLPRGALSVRDARGLLGPAAPIGVSCHSPAECALAAEQGADLVTLSPIWPSPGKGEALGPAAIREARSIMKGGAKLVALGGVDDRNAPAALDAGADGVAAIRWAWAGST